MQNKDNSKDKKNIYILDMFPYPSGDGLHVGHPKGYIATDIYARQKKMAGYNVVHPMGWDAFGLPAEQYAIKNKIHPSIAVEKNIANFKDQLNRINLDYNWDREISTTDPKFYKWTQWIFKQLYKKGLAFESFEPINWCPSCKTGLANEDLDGNVCERCGTVVEKKPLRQWNLKITSYADRLIDDLDTLTEWPEGVKTAQRNWIGRSEGSEIDFKIVGGDKNINFSELDTIGLVGYGTSVEIKTKYTFESAFKVFTTRADTLFGCTYCVLAPEHALVLEMLSKNILNNKDEVENYISLVKEKTDIERGAEGKEKTGVKLQGVMAVNPANGKEVPVYIADYVLASYGTGAIMAVPAHDERDREFAVKYNIEILDVPFVDVDKILEKTDGKKVTKYKLRDWVFARQRYWGEPFPVVYATKINAETGEMERDSNVEPIMVADSELPVLLPQVESYEPTGTGESPLAIIDSFVNVYGYINDDGEFVSCDKSDTKAKLFKRETNTMPQWAGSSWYYLRFLDPQNDQFLIDPSIEKEWQHTDENGNRHTVDLYVGGDHATRHLIYARFWHKFLYDIGVVTTLEPFGRLEFLGFILAPDGSKMSKSKGNVINPNSVIDEYGSDTFRMYEMFMAPFEATAVWSTSGIKGVKRFLERVQKIKNSTENTISVGCKNENIIHQTIKKVTDDIETFKFNTAVSQMMICLNEFEEKGVSDDEYEKFMTVLAPFAPTLCAEHLTNSWPIYDENKLQSEEVTIAVQIAGKMRGTFTIHAGASDEEVMVELEKTESYKKYVIDTNSLVKKTVVVKNKLVNVVV